MSVNRPEEENEGLRDSAESPASNDEVSADSTDSDSADSDNTANTGDGGGEVSSSDETVVLPTPPGSTATRRQRREAAEKAVREEQEQIRKDYENRYQSPEDDNDGDDDVTSESAAAGQTASDVFADDTKSEDSFSAVSSADSDDNENTENTDDADTIAAFESSASEREEKLRHAENASLLGAMKNKQDKDKASPGAEVPFEEEKHAEKKDGKGKKVAIAVIVGLLLVLGGIIAWWFLAEEDEDEVGPEPAPPVETEAEEEPAEPEPVMVTVPEAAALEEGQIEIDEEATCEPFIEAGLECSATEDFDDEVARGQVLSQSVEAGEEAEEGTEIEVVYSAGPEEAVMPEVNNEPVDEVTETLYALGIDIDLDETGYESGSNLAEDRVIYASVGPGETVENRSLVALTISDGTVEIPNWSEELQEVVEEEAADLNITLELEAEESDETTGTVVAQSDVGTVDIGSTVTVSIAVPFENVPLEVPDVINETPELAQADLAEAGFRNLTTVTVPSTEVDEPTVTQVVPGVGSTGMSEEQVVLIVSEPVEDVDEEESAEDIEDQ